MAPDLPTPDQIIEIGHAFRASKALLSAVELRIFTILADGPLNLASLSEKADLHQRAARDFLDALVALGMLARDQDGRYGNARVADVYLDRNKPEYVGALLESANSRHYGVWASLTTALRTGQPQCDKSAVSNFSALYADEQSKKTFAGAMTVRSRPVAKALSSVFPWSHYNVLVDIGTAEGCLPVEIAKAHPHITGGGLDLSALHAQFDRYVQERGLSDRLRFYPGDFFKDPLPPADVLVLGRVLHSWDIATKRMLLKKAYDALAPGGALIVHERLIDDSRRANANALLSSLNMLLVSTGGFDFTGADCVGWMREAGFREIRVEPLTADQSMVVGVKRASN
jgi:SAM-dependent methyltransferase